MEKKVFCQLLADAMEYEEELSLDMSFDGIEEYDSLAVLGFIALIHKNFGVQLKASQFQKVSSAQNLVDMIGEEKFS